MANNLPRPYVLYMLVEEIVQLLDLSAAFDTVDHLPNYLLSVQMHEDKVEVYTSVQVHTQEVAGLEQQLLCVCTLQLCLHAFVQRAGNWASALYI